MDFIRMYYSNMDVMPKVLLNQFFRYMGFYVEEIVGNTKPSDKQSSFDIYIIGDEYWEEKGGSFLIDNIEKAILIFAQTKQDMQYTDEAHIVRYSEDLYTFLKTLIVKMCDIYDCQMSLERRLLDHVDDLRETLLYMTQKYLDNGILHATIYARCCYEQERLREMAFDSYRGFIRAMEQYSSDMMRNDYIIYVVNYAKFEFDIICQKNSYELYYPVEQIKSECMKLVEKYEENEQLRIFQADVDWELDDFWSKAANEFGDVRISKCAYALYKRGKIIRNYTKDYEIAINFQKWAIRYKEDYYCAWYQLAACYEEIGDYRNAIEALEKVCVILKGKFQRHLLSPTDLDYLYKAVTGIARLYEEKEQNIYMATEYWELAKILEKEVENTNFLHLIWPEISYDLELQKIIIETSKIKVGNH